MISARYTQAKTNTINLKTLDQSIKNPVIAGGGDTNGRTLRIIMTQEAAAMVTPETKVYLKWYNQKSKVRGYDLFKKVSLKPLTWEIKFPQNMLDEGIVLACIQLVDDISVSSSTNFHIEVLADIWDGFDFEETEEFSVFNDAVIKLNRAQREAEKQLEEQNREFENMKWDLETVRDTANASYDIALEALAKAEEGGDGSCTCDDIASEIKINEF